MYLFAFLLLSWIFFLQGCLSSYQHRQWFASEGWQRSLSQQQMSSQSCCRGSVDVRSSGSCKFGKFCDGSEWLQFLPQNWIFLPSISTFLTVLHLNLLPTLNLDLVAFSMCFTLSMISWDELRKSFDFQNRKSGYPVQTAFRSGVIKTVLSAGKYE